MGKEILTFGNIEIEKKKFYRHRSSIFEEDVDIKKELVTNKISSSDKKYKYFSGYLHNYYKVQPLHICFLNQALM